MFGQSAVEMTDITKEFNEACRQALGLGELIRLETFQLHDSIAALEIMDPKMDNGVIDAKELALGAYDCNQDLTSTQVLDVMDQLLASEMAWQTGASLAQTLYTCVYVQALLGPRLPSPGSRCTWDVTSHPLHEQVLFPYVAATIRCCDFAREEFITGRLYDEEDVSAHDFDERMLSNEPVDVLERLLEDGIAWCQAENLDDLGLRLKTRQALLKLLSSLNDAQALLEDAATLQSLLERIRPRACTLQPDMLAAIFNPHLQRRFASTTPPRPIVTMSTNAAITLLKQLCQDMAPLKVLMSDAAQSAAAMHAYLEMLRSRPEPYLPLTRSLMQNHFQPDTLADQYTFVSNAIQEIVGERPDYFGPDLAAVEQPTDRRFKVHALVTAFLRKLAPPVLDIFRIYWHNPARQRRNLCKILLDLDVLQHEAETIDQEVGPAQHLDSSESSPSTLYPLSSWIYYTKLDLMVKILLMGFEQDLYRPWELGMVYIQLRSTLFHKVEMLKATEKDSQLAKQKQVRERLQRILLHDNTLVSVIVGHIDASLPYPHDMLTKQLLIAIKRLNLIKEVSCPFGSRSLLHEYRFKPFQQLGSPQLWKYFEIRNALEPLYDDPIGLVHNAITTLTDARQKTTAAMKQVVAPHIQEAPGLAANWSAEAKSMIMVCIANGVFASRLCDYVEDGAAEGRQVDINFTCSRLIPVFSFRE